MRSFLGSESKLARSPPYSHKSDLSQEEEFLVNPPTALLNDFHINNKTTLAFCLQAKATCGPWSPTSDPQLH